MERLAAIQQFVSRSRWARKAIHRITQWDELATLRTNKRRLRFNSTHAAYLFSQNYGLKFVPIGYARGRTKLVTMRRQAATILRKRGWGLADIGFVFDITKQRINQLLRLP